MKKRLCCHCKSYFDINHPKECLHQECEECKKLEKLNEYYIMRISIEKNIEEEKEKERENKKKYSYFFCWCV
jgi:hypothetical protein